MDHDNQTREISISDLRKFLETANKDSKQVAPKAKDKHELIFVIRGMIERIILPEGERVTLGRADTTFTGNLVDLTPYEAIERGVSRIHAAIHMQGEDVYVTDLESRNGTFLNGTRLEPNQAVQLGKTHDLMLGTLPIQVMFRTPNR